MNFKKFVDFNSHCPVCGKPLKLYLQLLNSMCFKAEKIGLSDYKFTQAYCKNDKFKNKFIIMDTDNIKNTFFSSSELEVEVLKSQMHFFYVCNEAGFKTITDSWNNKEDYEIKLYYSCYYRSTPVFKFIKNKHLFMKDVDEKTTNMVNSDESFSINTIKNNLEKVYMISMDYQNDKTMLWHYTCNEEQAKQKSFAPKIFEKSLPLLKRLPDFSMENREKLINKFDGWILMS